MTTLPILNFISASLKAIFGGILGLLAGFISQIFQSFGISVTSVYAGFAADIVGYGIWSVPLMVALLGITGAGVYIVLDGLRLANDFI